MTRFTTKLGSVTRHSTSWRCATIAAIFALTCGCNARLSVSDEHIDTGLEPGVDAGMGGTSGTNRAADATPTTGSCQARVLNGDESDMDCGGSACPPCSAQLNCSVHADCQSSSCRSGLCRAPACDDGVKNGEETSVDCGGPSCMRCASSTCNCASTSTLMALECDETEGPISSGGQPMIASDGESAVFMMCHSSVTVPGTPTCSTFRWTNAGTEKLASFGAYAASRSAREVLVQNDVTGSWSLLHVGGETTPLPMSFPVVLSADGTKLVGVNPDVVGPRTLQRWSEPGGLEVLTELPSPSDALGWIVQAVSSDGSSITGFVETDSGDIPFLWTEAGGLVTLGPIPEDATGARPAALSEDGSVVVGMTTRGATQHLQVFRWTAGGLQTLAPGQPQDQSRPSVASAAYMELSPDGAVLAATVAYPNEASLSAWRFSTTDGESFLSTESPAIVHDMTPDGTTLIGIEGNDYVKWVAQPAVPNEPRQFSSVRFSTALESQGVDLSEWELGPPTSVSDDGRVMFGRGSCGGVQTIYRWVSPP